MMNPMSLKRRSILVVTLLVLGGSASAACASGTKRDAATFCKAYVTVARQGAALPDPDEVSLVALRDQVTQIAHDAGTAVDHAPTAISHDAEAVIAPLATLRSALDAATTREGADHALRAYLTASNSTRSSQQRLDAWVAANCHVAPVTTATPTTTVAGAVGTTG